MRMLFFLIIIIILIISSPIVINISILKDNKNDEIIIKFKLLYGLIKYKKEYPLVEIDLEEDKGSIKVSEETENNIKSGVQKEESKKYNIDKIIEKYREGTEVINKYRQPINYVLNKISWESFKWVTELGVNDAAITGLVTGIIRILKGNVVAFLNNNSINFESIFLNVIPNFNCESFKTRLNCIFSLKIGYIIIAGFKLIRLKYSRI